LPLTVVHVHGNDVLPVVVDELRIAPAETYDVIVRPRDDRQYPSLAESMGRQGFAQASLATREGLPALPLPPHRARPVLTMADMAMNPGPTGLDRGTLRPEVDRPGQVTPAMDMGDMDHGSMPGMGGGAMAGMDHSAMGHGAPPARAGGSATTAQAGMQGMDHSNMPGMDHSAMGHGSGTAQGRVMDHSAMGHSGDPRGGDAFTSTTGAPPGTRVLSYTDLRAMRNPYPVREPDRVLEMRLTGNMERYFWAINGNRFSEAQPIVLRLGERVRMRFINETMMSHPMHLHGLWMQPQVGNGARNPLLHVINVQPNTTIDVDVEADAEGGWGFHCHMLYHMETGMMRAVHVVRDPAQLVSAG
jgi:FtsP/CotA-like multicopper oxidase with cupredoxin domain